MARLCFHCSVADMWLCQYEKQIQHRYPNQYITNFAGLACPFSRIYRRCCLGRQDLGKRDQNDAGNQWNEYVNKIHSGAEKSLTFS